MPVIINRAAASTVSFSSPQEIIIDHSNDCIRLGDGTTLTTANTIASDHGQDVNVISQLATSGDTSIVNVTTGETTINPITDQLHVTITSLGNGDVHYALETGVSTSNARLRRDDQLVVENYQGSIFLIRAAGSSDVQVDVKVR